MLNCKHIFRMITYSINAHPVIALMFSQTGTDVLPWRDEGSGKPSATIEPHRIMVPDSDSNPGGQIESPMLLPLYYRGSYLQQILKQSSVISFIACYI